MTAAGGTSEEGTVRWGSRGWRVWRVAHLYRGVEDGLSLKAYRAVRDAAHDQAAVDAGGLAVVFGAVMGSGGISGGGLAVGGASLLEMLQVGAGATCTSPWLGVKDQGLQLKQIFEGGLRNC
jgi:hypothetical protein